MKNIHRIVRFVSLVLLVISFAASAQAQSKPKWIIAHKINQLDQVYTREVPWPFPPDHYPGCFADAGFKGTEESLDAYFYPIGQYTYANGFEFDLWYNEPGDDINGYGADQRDIHGNDVVTGQWYVSHEPCDNEHVPFEEYVDYLKAKLDLYGTSRVALIYVDMKGIENHIFFPLPTYDPIEHIRSTLRSKLGSHYNNINFLYSHAEWTGRGAFLEDDFIPTMLPNELVGIDEDNDDAADDDTEAALVAIQWASDSSIKALYLTDDTEETRLEFIRWMESDNYPSVVGGWTISSDTGISGSDTDADDYWDEGVNLFLIQNFWEADIGTGAYEYLNTRISLDPGSHLATGLDRPWQNPPTAEAGGPYNVSEGGSVTLSSAGSSDPDGDALTFNWDLDYDGSFETPGAAPAFSAAGRNGPDTQTVVLQVWDGTFYVTDAATVNILNVAPTINSISVSPASFDEGGSVGVSGSFSDPGTGETHTGTAIWSDGFVTALTVDGLAGTFSSSRAFPDDDPSSGTPADTFTVDITIDDGDGGSDAATSPVVTVNNVPPSNLALSAATIDENGVTTLNGSFDDPGVLDTFLVEVNWGDPLSPANAESFNFGTSDVATPGVTWTAATRAFSIEHRYLDDNPTGTPADAYTISVAVTDDDTGNTAETTTVTVENVDPAATVDSVIDQLTGLTITHLLNGVVVPGALDGVLLGTTIEVEGSYSDVGTRDTHSGMINWDDGTGDEALGLLPNPPPDQSSGVTDAASHAYDSGLAPGSYGIGLTITDDDTGSATPTAEIEVVGAEGALEDALDDIQDVIDGGGLDPEAELALYESIYKIIGNPDSGGDDENGALDHLERNNLKPTLIKIRQAILYLEDAEAADAGVNMTAVKAQLALTANSIVRSAIDDAIAAAGNPGAFKKIAAAEALLGEGNEDLSAGDYLAAMDDYIEAIGKVENLINPEG